MFEQYFFTFGAFSLAAYGLWGFVSNLKKARIIEDVPTSKIRSASQGYVELKGTAKAINDIIVVAPLTDTQCLWYDYKIEELTEVNDSTMWKVVAQKTSSQRFIIEDETGECVIEPLSAEVETDWKKVWHGATRYPLKPGQPDYYSTGARVDIRYRYTERCILESDFLHVMGKFHTLQPVSLEEQVEVRTIEILRAWKQDSKNLVFRFDRDGDGQVDLEEWQQARLEAADEARDDVLFDFNPDPIDVVVKPNNESSPYIISNHKPEHLVKTFRRRAIAMLALFLVATYAAIHLLALFFE